MTPRPAGRTWASWWRRLERCWPHVAGSRGRGAARTGGPVGPGCRSRRRSRRRRGAQIRHGVARDRVVSHSDPEMRHGRKSASRRFDGHKMDLISDEDSELILGVDVRAGNAGDGDGAAPLLARCKTLTVSRSTRCWATWPTATATSAKPSKKPALNWWPRCHRRPMGAGSPRPTSPSTPGLPRSPVPPGRSPPMPARPRTTRVGGPPCSCSPRRPARRCPLREQCTTSTAAGGIMVGRHEDRIAAARAAQTDPATRALLRRRAKVERKIDHVQDLGMRKSRYRGRRKTKLQALLAATVANFKRLGVLGAFPRLEDGNLELQAPPRINPDEPASRQRHPPERSGSCSHAANDAEGPRMISVPAVGLHRRSPVAPVTTCQRRRDRSDDRPRPTAKPAASRVSWVHRRAAPVPAQVPRDEDAQIVRSQSQQPPFAPFDFGPHGCAMTTLSDRSSTASCLRAADEDLLVDQRARVPPALGERRRSGADPRDITALSNPEFEPAQAVHFGPRVVRRNLAPHDRHR